MLVDCMHCTYIQSESIFNLYWTLLNMESKGPELSVHIIEVSIIIVEVQIIVILVFLWPNKLSLSLRCPWCEVKAYFTVNNANIFLHNCNCSWPTGTCSYNHYFDLLLNWTLKPCNQKLSWGSSPLVTMTTFGKYQLI